MFHKGLGVAFMTTDTKNSVALCAVCFSAVKLLFVLIKYMSIKERKHAVSFPFIPLTYGYTHQANMSV